MPSFNYRNNNATMLKRWDGDQKLKILLVVFFLPLQNGKISFWQCSGVLLQGFWCKNILGRGNAQLLCNLKTPFLYVRGCWNLMFYFLQIFFENVFPLFTPWTLQKKNSVSEVKFIVFDQSVSDLAFVKGKTICLLAQKSYNLVYKSC